MDSILHHIVSVSMRIVGALVGVYTANVYTQF